MDLAVINKRLQLVKDLGDELRVMKEQYEEALENDPQYQKMQEKVEKLKEEAREEKNQVTDKVLNKSTFQNLRDDMKEKQEEIKTAKEVLSQELVEYYKSTGQMEIEDVDGTVRKMKFSVKLVS